MVLKSVSPQIDFVQVEKEILKWWHESGVVKKYLEKNKDSKKKFSFLDGPITANNPMGVQHGQGRTLKDLFQRYKNMQGFKQRFQNGFDCQGLWLEVQEERELGLNSKRDIEKFGIEKFCLRCRARVNTYSHMQTEQSKRLGMFMDWDNSYYTMSETNNLYIWHFLQICHQKGWLYKGVDSMPWCPRCGTAISHHELSDDGYKDVEHTSVYVKFPLKNQVNVSLLIWTTTPWTLTANIAVAVHPKTEYVKVKIATGDHLILARSRQSVINGESEVIDSFLGQTLVGLTYSGPYDDLPSQQGITHRVIPWSDVSDAEGTGLVHIAPGAGEEDFDLGQKYHLPVIAPLDEFGLFMEGFSIFSNRPALEVSQLVFQTLKDRGRFYKTESLTHSYPHCWRCKHELVFRATSEWFISVKEVRPLMKQAAKKVNWLPPSALKRMNDWLTHMGDWPISRRRYWGLALPFYECPNDHLPVVGSKEELKTRAIHPELVDQLPELHRPWIDTIAITCSQCGQEANRVKEVGDCWLDAGIVPFSTTGYLKNRAHWQAWFPFEFITEFVSQIKLWFYSTLFMSVTLENTAPWKNVLATGYVVDAKGEPMHKTKGNDIPFDEAADKMGADVMRWIYTASNPYGNIKFGYSMGDEVRRRFFLILWNIYNFFVTYARVDGFEANRISARPSVLDRWITARLNTTIQAATQALDKYQAHLACRTLEEFVSDLSSWYVRRSRHRVGPTVQDKMDKSACYSTLHQVLESLCLLLAPFAPFISEEIYRNITGQESVHLTSWPQPAKLNSTDTRLIRHMQTVRQIVELGLAKRKEAGIRIRQPLRAAEVTISTPSLNQDLKQLVLDELNLKTCLWKKGAKLSVDLDINLDSSLIAEGALRDLIRQVQETRKTTGARIDQPIILHAPLPTDPQLVDQLQKQTLAVAVYQADTVTVELQ